MTMDSITERMHAVNVLVTGASGGIGGATAELFAAKGATVYLTDVDDAAGRSRAHDLGPNAHYRRLDVANPSDWQAVTSDMARAGHPLHVLVNSAGAAMKAPLNRTTLEQFRKMIDLNLIGTFLGLQAASEAMGPGGTVINISSLRGVLATADSAHTAPRSPVSAP